MKKIVICGTHGVGKTKICSGIYNKIINEQAVCNLEKEGYLKDRNKSIFSCVNNGRKFIRNKLIEMEKEIH